MADFRRGMWATQSRPPIAAPRLRDEEINPSAGWIPLPESHCLLVDLPGFKNDDIKVKVDESGRIVVGGRRRIGKEKQVHFEKSFDVPEDGDLLSIRTIFEQDKLRVSVPKVAREMKEEPKKTNSSDTKTQGPASTNEAEEEEEKIESPASRSSNAEEKKPEEYESPASSSDTKEKVQDDTREEAEAGEGEKKEDASSCYTKEEQESKSPAFCTDIMEEKTQQVRSSKEEERSSLAEKSSHTSPVIVKIIENKGILIASVLSFALGVLLSQKFHPIPPK